LVGADIAQFRGVSGAAAMAAGLAKLHAVFDRLEALPFPTVAVAHGFCLGGGLELALACRFRIAVSDAQFGFPEVQLGLHPGLGGVARSIRLIGPVEAMTLMLTGKSLRASQAKRVGLVDAVVEERHVAAAVKAAVEGKLKRKPLGATAGLAGSALGRPIFASLLRRETARKARPEHYPAPYALIALWQRHGGSFEALKAAEVPSFSRLIVTPQAQNLVRLFFLREGLKGWAKGGSPVQRLHVIGAGAMGGDIAAWCAYSGLTVTLADNQPKALGGAIKRAGALFARRHLRGKLLREAIDRLVPDPKGEGASGADLIIEAVPEKLPLKQSIYASVEPRMKPGAILASNTSSLKLEDLRGVLKRPQDFVGIHFFNPVAQMQLVEIVHHDQAAEKTVTAAGGFVNGISRLPAKVASAPGFLVNRALTPYLVEAMVMADEGVKFESIDDAAERFGMPMGPIELADQVGLDICLAVGDMLRAKLDHTLPPAPDWLREKVSKGELGRKTGKGFYEWKDGKAIKTTSAVQPTPEMIDRLILPMSNVCVACLNEGIVGDADVVDGAMIFGTGYAPFRGGPLNYARTRGPQEVVATLESLATRFGDRFKPDAGWASFS
jgi:3-hydroxyacyl-CoA dehydrogenase/enoyl-CoA hydratase/3-hydroxybutyryl-CoA epimerase